MGSDHLKNGRREVQPTGTEATWLVLDQVQAWQVQEVARPHAHRPLYRPRLQQCLALWSSLPTAQTHTHTRTQTRTLFLLCCHPSANSSSYTTPRTPHINTPSSKRLGPWHDSCVFPLTADLLVWVPHETLLSWRVGTVFKFEFPMCLADSRSSTACVLCPLIH